VRVHLLPHGKHLFRDRDAMAHRLGLADRHWRRKSLVAKRTLDGTDPIERLSDQVDAVDLHDDLPAVHQEQTKDRADASAIEGDAMYLVT
jgi:hypothetical protein